MTEPSGKVRRRWRRSAKNCDHERHTAIIGLCSHTCCEVIQCKECGTRWHESLVPRQCCGIFDGDDWL